MYICKCFYLITMKVEAQDKVLIITQLELLDENRIDPSTGITMNKAKMTNL